jgi:hypothetical protein
MRRRLGAGTYPMGGGPKLIGGHLAVLSAHPPAAPPTPPYLHLIALHFRLRDRRHIRDGGLFGPLILQLTAAAGALIDRDRHLDA